MSTDAVVDSRTPGEGFNKWIGRTGAVPSI
jgi:hypothetical protein